MHSISRNTPRYTYPNVPDISEWQQDLMARLQQWCDAIPRFDNNQNYMTLMCRVKYHELLMLLLRPSPRISRPSKESMIKCHGSAIASTRLWKELYEADRLTYSWTTIHSVSLSVTTMLYCIWTVPSIAEDTKVDALIGDIRTASNVLSAAGEHWPEAKKSRDILDELGNATIRWLMDARAQQTNTQYSAMAGTRHSANSVRESISQCQPLATSVDFSAQSQPLQSLADSGVQRQYADGMQVDSSYWPFANASTGIESYINPEDLAAYLGAPDQYSSDISMTMQSIFSEFQPTFDFDWTDDSGTQFRI